MKLLNVSFEGSVTLPHGATTNSPLAASDVWELSPHAQGVMVVHRPTGKARLYPWVRVLHVEIDHTPVSVDVAPQGLLPEPPSSVPAPVPRGRPRAK